MAIASGSRSGHQFSVTQVGEVHLQNGVTHIHAAVDGVLGVHAMFLVSLSEFKDLLVEELLLDVPRELEHVVEPVLDRIVPPCVVTAKGLGRATKNRRYRGGLRRTAEPIGERACPDGVREEGSRHTSWPGEERRQYNFEHKQERCVQLEVLRPVLGRAGNWLIT